MLQQYPITLYMQWHGPFSLINGQNHWCIEVRGLRINKESDIHMKFNIVDTQKTKKQKLKNEQNKYYSDINKKCRIKYKNGYNKNKRNICKNL